MRTGKYSEAALGAATAELFSCVSEFGPWYRAAISQSSGSDCLLSWGQQFPHPTVDTGFPSWSDGRFARITLKVFLRGLTELVPHPRLCLWECLSCAPFGLGDEDHCDRFLRQPFPAEQLTVVLHFFLRTYGPRSDDMIIMSWCQLHIRTSYVRTRW